MMQATNLNMIQNRIKNAQYKLAQHKAQGVKSSLSVFQVAQLMDTVKRGEELEEGNTHSIYFSWN